MGSRLNVSIGLYIKVKNGNIPVECLVPIKTCTSIKCNRHGKYSGDAFCPTCGSKVDTVGIAGERILDISGFEGMEDCEDTFMYTEYNFNQDKDLFLLYNYSNFISDDDTFIASLEEVIKGKEECMAHFNGNKKAQQFLSILQTHLGKENVTLEYGVMAMWW